MNIIEIVFGALLMVISLFIIVVVVLQESRQSDMSGVITGSTSESFLGKRGRRDKEAILSRITKICAVLLFIFVVAVNLFSVFFAK